MTPTRRIATFLASALFAFGASFAQASYVFVPIDYPGALSTDVRGISDNGRVAGYTSLDGVSNFGFTYFGGAYTPLPPIPGSTDSFAQGVNDSGTVTGGALIGAGYQGFVLTGSTYAFFSKPGWVNTYGRAISNSGIVTGYADDNAGNTSGFIYDPNTATFTDIVVPGSVFTIVQGMNAAGQVVGSALIPGMGTNGFLREPDGTITLFKIAGASTRARGINDNGLITGSTTSAGLTHAFVASSSGYELLDAGGADGFTAGQAINNLGQIAGLFFDATTSHGFVASPASTPTGTTSSGAYTFSVDVVPNTVVFIDPPVAVAYDYALGDGDPAFASVSLPIGIGDSLYLLVVDGRRFTLAGGATFDFRANGFKNGVKKFRVACIEASAGLDPANSQAFPTGLTFVSAGRFTGTQQPLSNPAHGPSLCERATLGNDK